MNKKTYLKNHYRFSLRDTLTFYLYFMVLYLKNRSARGPVCLNKGDWICRDSTNDGLKYARDLQVAIISDEMTYKNFSYEFNLHYLTPNNWKTVLTQNKIDFFLCESAWEGRKEDKQCWRGKIYKNHQVGFETRKELLQILKFCKNNKIPTVFWNKEDPTYFGDIRHDFVDTALNFNFIFTTAEECVKKYKALGHEHVYLMMFGFSPYIYNPLKSLPKKRQAIFAGSWFAEEQQRCKDMCVLFQKVLDSKITLSIYDRQSLSRKKRYRYPSELNSYIHPAVSQTELGDEIKKSSYAINVNTVTESDSMFARRVYELMASNAYIISNQSNAMNKQLSGRYSGCGDEIPIEISKICRDNVDYVFQRHTNQIRILKMLEDMHYCVLHEKISVAVYSTNEDIVILGGENMMITLFNKIQSITEDFDYIVIWDSKTVLPLAKVLPHFQYILLKCGIRISSQDLYNYVEDRDNSQVVFPISVLKELQQDITVVLKKYHI